MFFLINMEALGFLTHWGFMRSILTPHRTVTWKFTFTWLISRDDLVESGSQFAYKRWSRPVNTSHFFYFSILVFSVFKVRNFFCLKTKRGGLYVMVVYCVLDFDSLCTSLYLYVFNIKFGEREGIGPGFLFNKTSATLYLYIKLLQRLHSIFKGWFLFTVFLNYVYISWISQLSLFGSLIQL